MLRTAILLLALFTLLWGCRKEEEATPKVKLEGIIRDEFGGAMSGVFCKLESARGKHDAVTSTFGSFQMKDIEAGDYTFTASKDGYITLSKPMRLGVDPGKVELVLSSGSSFLRVADSVFLVPPGASSVSVKLESNVTWEVTGSAWLTVSPSQGSGNATLFISWPASEEDESRTGLLSITSGSLQRTIRVEQEPPVKIMAVATSYGNLLYAIEDSIHLDLNRVATVSSVTSSLTTCVQDIKFKVTGKRVSLTYGCTRMGESYSITVSGKLGVENFSVTAQANFFDKKMHVPGYIDDYILEPDNSALWAITRFPNKLYRISLPDMTITKELSLSINPSAVRWNTFAGKLNLFYQTYCALA
ncbi:MAG: hypothetical protein JNN04_09815, partial [Cyclobacteriaceae bacterium]|nr:hypothetical protein [Cyclobacteriaceae bacterium]